MPARKTKQVVDFKQALKASAKSKGSKAKRGDVQNFSDFQPENPHRRFDKMVGETIYIVAIEPQKSKKFGRGYKVYYKTSLAAADIFNASVYGQYVVPLLDNMYTRSKDGKNITPEHPVKAKVVEAGPTYRFE